MPDDLRASYESLPYPQGAVPDAHPGRMGLIGRLFGIDAVPPEEARVLEVGCAEGMNLLALGERFPAGRFVGVDFSKRQIETGEIARKACGLENVELICADLREYEPPAGRFDYVIAHGVYSWVPDEVKRRLLEVVSTGLGENGVGYVSYNVLPGWGLLGGLRRVLMAEVKKGGTLEEVSGRLDAVLAALGRGLGMQPGAYAAFAREHILEMRRKPIELLLHDELELVNDPCTFLEFVDAAGRYGLHYLAEAHFAAMPFEHLPAEIRAVLTGLGLDFLGAQQYLDVLCQRWLRNSLLVKRGVDRAALNFLALRDCALGLRLRVDGAVDLRKGSTMRFLGRPPLAFTFDEPMYKGVLTVLAEAAPGRVRYADAVEEAARRLRGAGVDAGMNDDALCRMLAKLFALDALDVILAGSGDWVEMREDRGPSKLMRWQAENGRPVVNRWHENPGLTGAELEWLAAGAEDFGRGALEQAGLVG